MEKSLPNSPLGISPRLGQPSVPSLIIPTDTYFPTLGSTSLQDEIWSQASIFFRPGQLGMHVIYDAPDDHVSPAFWGQPCRNYIVGIFPAYFPPIVVNRLQHVVNRRFDNIPRVLGSTAECDVVFDKNVFSPRRGSTVRRCTNSRGVFVSPLIGVNRY
jgi:hypothetical protein